MADHTPEQVTHASGNSIPSLLARIRGSFAEMFGGRERPDDDDGRGELEPPARGMTDEEYEMALYDAWWRLESLQ